jgi:hypothetical protein
VIVEDGEVRAGEAGKGAGPAGVDGVQGDVTISGGDGNYVDEPVIALVGADTFISAKNLTIMGGDALGLEINSLDEEAIHVKGRLILAVGAGGKLDLTDNDSRIFLVDGSFLIYATANAIILDDGISLADLSNLTPQVLGYRILYAVRLVAPQILLVRPGDQVRIPLLVSNFGPAGDSYRVARTVSVQSSGRNDVEPWSVSEPPSILPVAGSTINRTAIFVTVPGSAKVGSRQTVQISADSYSDETVQALGATQLIVQAGGPRVRPIFLPSVMHLFDRAAAQAPAATDHLYLPSISR